MTDTGETPTRWANRIVRYDPAVDPEQLLAHPANARIHPRVQARALIEGLSRVGWVAPVIVNERTGFVVDGHLRIGEAISADETVPVAYVDLSEAEEAEVLATFDPIGAAAITDTAALARLTAEMDLPDAQSAIVDEILSGAPGAAPGEQGDAQGAAEDAAGDDGSGMSWGYATFGRTRVGCSVAEVDQLEALLADYKSATGGVDIGFVRWLAVADRPDPAAGG